MAATSSDGLLKVGEHCAYSSCHKLDFLPFRCLDCRAEYCSDHRYPSAHECPALKQSTNITSNSSRSIGATGGQKLGGSERTLDCSATACKMKINTALAPAIQCPKCRQMTCLKHRLDHSCPGAPTSSPTSSQGSSTETGTLTAKAALAKFKKWTQEKHSKLSGPLTPSSPSSAVARAKELADLKQRAKGDTQVPVANRLYVFVESEYARTLANGVKLGREKMFFGKDWPIGKVLDKAAIQLQISNLNSSRNDDKDRLRIYHVQGGRILEFSQRLNTCKVKDGDTLVIVKGVQLPSLLH
ncbi:hypothetical protein V1511DRAFT_520123 [Dipodascopsis uninucleata]